MRLKTGRVDAAAGLAILPVYVECDFRAGHHCPGFGQCIGDYREAHCHRCGDHYFAGMSGFRCPCRGGGGGFDDSGADDSDSSSGYESPTTPSVDDASAPAAAASAWDAVLPGIVQTERGELLERAEKAVGPGSALAIIAEEGLLPAGVIEGMMAELPSLEDLRAMSNVDELRETVEQLDETRAITERIVESALLQGSKRPRVDDEGDVYEDDDDEDDDDDDDDDDARRSPLGPPIPNFASLGGGPS